MLYFFLTDEVRTNTLAHGRMSTLTGDRPTLLRQIGNHPTLRTSRSSKLVIEAGRLSHRYKKLTKFYVKNCITSITVQICSLSKLVSIQIKIKTILWLGYTLWSLDYLFFIVCWHINEYCILLRVQNLLI